MQLQETVSEFQRAGIGVVAMTYDEPETLVGFAQEQGISYPLLSDVEQTSVKALEILNQDFEAGHFAYGVPYPGAFILDPAMRIKGKLFIEGYQERVSAEQTLAVAKAKLGID